MEKLKKEISWLNVALIAGATYIAACIPNTIKLNKKLEPVRQEFIKVANQGAEKRYSDYSSGSSTLDYGGKLDNIAKEREAILKENHGIQLEGWKVSSNDYKKYKDRKNLKVYAPRVAICYDPFKKIK